MKSTTQIAKDLGVNVRTLKRRIRDNRIAADAKEQIGNITRRLYGAAAVRKIKSLFKNNPVGSKLGRPSKSQGGTKV